ncbi:MAG: type II secretion system major pseudopilin GspG [Planctomycetes bacterium]|nr:type II secretion system major pseudopilin GspG [Planctomycetota bacterium]
MKSKPAQSLLRPAEAGFTLVEIMVVIVILGLLATLVATNVIGASDEARVTKAQTDVQSIASTVKYYRSKNGKLPESLEALATKDEKGNSYLDQLSKDPWGHDYILREGDTPQDWEVVSSGPDEIEGTEDDISSKMKKDQ